MGDEGTSPKWVSYSSEDPPTDEISYAEASEYQQTEFGSLFDRDDSSPRARRLNRREGWSPTDGDKHRFADALASSLELPDSQKKEICAIMRELNLSAFGSQREIETVTLGVIAVVVNYDRFQRQENPNATRIVETTRFRELMRDLSIDYSDIGTAKRIVKQELAEIDYFK
ncbi:hypothetical protein [Halorussus sp. AFM4]|uniref:hypothetical protein n=1 Tax=Halorussus sp. AFM4 TaxID=3421651 RepID=UPI003EBD80FE